MASYHIQFDNAKNLSPTPPKKTTLIKAQQKSKRDRRNGGLVSPNGEDSEESKTVTTKRKKAVKSVPKSSAADSHRLKTSASQTEMLQEFNL